ncbi:MAG: hypothetical protein J3Q66DRAFT_357792 [Benniella sp.]|nr:MAG: hypothetical protein J3Q66DRAFT_357792 [Benniella sp.]
MRDHVTRCYFLSLLPIHDVLCKREIKVGAIQNLCLSVVDRAIGRMEFCPFEKGAALGHGSLRKQTFCCSAVLSLRLRWAWRIDDTKSMRKGSPPPFVRVVVVDQAPSVSLVVKPRVCTSPFRICLMGNQSVGGFLQPSQKLKEPQLNRSSSSGGLKSLSSRACLPEGVTGRVGAERRTGRQQTWCVISMGVGSER